MKILFLIFFTAFLKRRIHTLSSDDCWNITEHVRYGGVLEKHPFESKDACLNICLSLPQCSVVNIDKKENKCLVQKEIYKVNETALVQDELVDNFFLKQICKRYPSIDIKCWTIRDKVIYPGLTSMPLYDLFSCLSFCTGMPLCGAINFDNRFVNPCWAQVRHFRIQRGSVKESPSTSTYFLDRKCLGTATYIIPQFLQPCWKQTFKRNYKGLSMKGYDRDEVGSCSTLCARNPDCQTFNFDVARSEKCWIQEKPGEFDNKNLKQHETAINYVLDRSCFDRLYPGEYSCWIISANSHLAGLEPTKYPDVYSCLAYCKLFPQCKVMEFNNDPDSEVKCWVQKSLFKPILSDKRPLGIRNFFFDDRCYNETFGVDLSCWYLNNRFSYFNDLAEPSDAKNLIECLAQCRLHEKCHVVDFYLSAEPQCRFQKEYLSFYSENLKPNNSSLNFILKPKCDKGNNLD